MRPRFTLAVMMLAAVLSAGCMSLPAGLRVYTSSDGCTPAGTYCAGHPANYYDPPGRAAVVAPGQSPGTILHEVCHAHQHEVVLESLHREPDLALTQWYLTNEGQAFLAATDWRPDGKSDIHGPTFYPNENPWGWLGGNPLEDAAWTCSHYLRGDPLDSARERWAETWLN